MSRVLFIRHAETEMAGRYCGHSDPDLNAQGRAQLTRLSRLLAEEMLETVYSSDLRRATSTAHAPWYIVPADDKEDARLIVSQIVLDTLEDLKMAYPATSAARRKELLAIRKQLTVK